MWSNNVETRKNSVLRIEIKLIEYYWYTHYFENSWKLWSIGNYCIVLDLSFYSKKMV